MMLSTQEKRIEAKRRECNDEAEKKRSQSKMKKMQ